jgi:GNAT superfamily N-acetyltransferase
VGEISFHPLTREHVDAVAHLVVRCDALVSEWAPPGWSLPEDWLATERRIWEQDLADETVWAEVACDAAAKVIGVASAQREGASDDAGAGGMLLALFVEPERHGQGIGGLLAARAEDWMRERGLTRALVNVLEDAPARGFYLAHGWRPDGRRATYEAFDLPTIGLAKKL